MALPSIGDGQQAGDGNTNEVQYVGRSGQPVTLSSRPVSKQGTPPTMTTVASITIADMLAGIIAATPTATGGTIAYTLPTGTLTDAGATFAVGDSFDWCLINSALAAADTITVTASTGHTIVGNPIVQSLHSTTGGIMGYSSLWRTRKTATNVFVTYRIA